MFWEETLGLEGRAEYYDRAGQLRDMIQNHLLQVLCLLTMEPDSLRAWSCTTRKVALLRSVRPPDPCADGRVDPTCGADTAGRSDGRHLPSYVDEAGVDSACEIETFAEVTFEIDNERWAANALRRPHRKGPDAIPYGGGGTFSSDLERSTSWRHNGGYPDELRIGLYEDDAIKLQLNRAVAGAAIPADSIRPYREPTAVGAAAVQPRVAGRIGRRQRVIRSRRRS